MSQSAPQAAATFDSLDRTAPRHSTARLAAGPLRWPQWLAICAAVGLVAALFGRAVPELMLVWDLDPNYSHGYFVPVLSLLFAYRAWRDVGPPVRTDVPRSAAWAGIAEVALGLALHLIAWFFHNLLLEVLALVCVVRGLLLTFGGREVNRAYGFAALFLLFMAPLPASWYQPLALFMQHLVSGISTALLDLFGVPVFRQGYLVQVPGYVMEVGAACSGLRQLTAFVALGVAIANLAGNTLWYRWTMALLGIPIALGTNCLRVVLTGLIMMGFGREWADGVFHTIEGLVTLALGSAMLAGAALLLARWDRPNPDSSTEAGPRPTVAGRSSRLRFAAAVVLLSTGWIGHTALARHLEAAGPLPVVPLAAPLAEVPLELGEWSGRELPVTDPKLQFGDEYHQRLYTHRATGEEAVVWMVYSRDGQDRGHHPEVCMAVAGQPEDRTVRQTLDAPGHPQPIQQYRFGALGNSVWVFYWHYTLVPPHDESIDRVQRLYQRLRQRPASVTLELFAPATASTDVALVQTFVRQLDAAVQPCVGPDARRDSRRVPVTLTETEQP